MKMEVLPAGFSGFRNKSYWNMFFSSFNNNNFEWYGSYVDIKQILYESIRRRNIYCDSQTANGNCMNDEFDNNEASNINEEVNKNCMLINVGCGNSAINLELFEDGFNHIVNLDYSEVVIQQMSRRYGTKMKFINVDIRDTTRFDELCNSLEEEKNRNGNDYKIILDKAFLDAYLSCEEGEEEECKKRAIDYFSVVNKHFKEGDIFIIITLGQEYILMELIRNIYDKPIKLEVYPFVLKENPNQYKYHPFAMVLYRSKSVQEFSTRVINLEKKEEQLTTLWKIPKKIREIQKEVHLKGYKEGQRIVFDVYNDVTNKCEYNLILFDSSVKNIKHLTAVIIIPLGQESHYLYATHEGNEELAELAKARRLLLIMNAHTQTTGGNSKNGLNLNGETMQEKIIKKLTNSQEGEDDDGEDMKKMLNELSLSNSEKLPIMVISESAKKCTIVYQQESIYANNIVIRDILCTQQFMEDHFNTPKNQQNKIEKNNPIFQLLEKRRKEKKKYFSNKEIYKRQMIFTYDPFTIQSELIYSKVQDQIHFEYIESASEYHKNFICAFCFLINENFESNKLIRLCILGGGTNIFSNIIRTIFCDFHLLMDIIELDQKVQECCSYFSTEIKNEKHTVNYILGDACEYVKNYLNPISEEKSSKNEMKYDFIFLDIDNSQNVCLQVNNQKLYMTCPNIRFLKKDLALEVKNMLTPKGILAINLLTRDEKAKTYVYSFFKEIFASIVIIKSCSKNEINEVLICSSNNISEEKISEFKNNIKYMIMKNHDKWFINFNLKEFMNNVKVL